MPIKQVTCCTCGDTVNKARTYCIDKKTGERACKTHDGVIEKSKDITEKQLNRAKISAAKGTTHDQSMRHIRESNKRTERAFQERKELEESGHVKCWICGCHGANYSNHCRRTLVAMSMFEKEQGRMFLPMPLLAITEEWEADSKQFKMY